MTHNGKALIEALAKELLGWRENDWDEDFSRRSAEAMAQRFAKVFRSFDLTPFEVKVPEAVKLVAISIRATAAHIKAVPDYANLLVDADKINEAANLIESLAAQLAERGKKIAELKKLATKPRQPRQGDPDYIASIDG